MTCFHGTSKKNYEKIMKEGVKSFSYWTPFMATALTQGGPYIIGVFFASIDATWLGLGGWEYRNPEVVLPKDFLVTMKFTNKVLSYNEKIDDKIRAAYKLQEGMRVCKHCNGMGETTYINDGRSWLIGGSSFKDASMKRNRSDGKINTCPKCKGYGGFELNHSGTKDP